MTHMKNYFTYILSGVKLTNLATKVDIRTFVR